MDRVGTYMCLATIPMALLTIASVVAGLGLLVTGDMVPVAAGLAAIAICSLLAPILEWLVVGFDRAAARALDRRGRAAANRVAIASGAVPVAVILSWEAAALLVFGTTPHGGLHPLAHWLWSYGVATIPWTLYALRVSRFRRTLVGIRAYAGHLAYWLLSALVLGLGVAPAAAAPAMLLPAILPFVVGMLLAVADREALKNVRV